MPNEVHRQSIPMPASYKGAIDQSKNHTQQLLVDSKTAAAMLSISERTLWSLKDKGIIPSRKINSLVRFYIPDLHAWIDAGCPRRNYWQQPSQRTGGSIGPH
ncbi:MAG: helix-turn-helix domain-containing protein [Phycisphaeraceae bacterium]|nr:helix-turn-helix domain-containing protein [Phycisphaerales bacterium]MCB9860850.1 helix-turn-helix domain-containing protein [Phycisphaeraceae bacterium]